MQDLLAARSQMAVSLGFHIVFASIGMAMPFLMAISHFRWLRTGNPVYRDLTKAWSRGVAIFFATGAVSGTALSFELGLLFPTFMKHAMICAIFYIYYIIPCGPQLLLARIILTPSARPNSSNHAEKLITKDEVLHVRSAA